MTGVGTIGDTAGMGPEAAAGRSHLVSPGKLALLRWHSLFKGLLEKRASRDFHGRKSSVRPGPLAQADF